MISIGQMLISLFTTGGKPNPFAIALALGATLYLYNDFSNWRERQAERKDCTTLVEAEREKVSRIAEVQDDREKAIKSIDPDDLNPWVDRINGMQRTD